MNTEGKYYAIYINFEVAQAERNSMEESIRLLVDEIQKSVESFIPMDGNFDPDFSAKENLGHNSFADCLTNISKLTSKPLVLLLDNLDCLGDEPLNSVLRQIRSRYHERPDNFPSSIIFAGIHDIKDYKIPRSEEDSAYGDCVFNIKAAVLQMKNFSVKMLKIFFFSTLKRPARDSKTMFSILCGIIRKVSRGL